jgi:hypothetical protein
MTTHIAQPPAVGLAIAAKTQKKRLLIDKSYV